MPLISIIMPVYNAESFLESAISSILKQTFNRFELIIVDDGSVDSSCKIISNFAKNDSRIKFIKNKHLGAAVARNVAVQESKGFYTLFVDSDDIYKTNMLESLYSKAVFTNADVVICGYRKFDNATKAKIWDFKPNPIFLFDERILTVNIYDKLFSTVPPSPWGKLIRSDLIKNNSIKFQDLSSCNDFAFSYSVLAMADTLAFVPEILLYYRANTNNNISKDRASKAENIFLAIIELESRLKKFGKYEHLKNTFFWRAESAINNELKNCSDLRKQELIKFAKEFNSQVFDEILSDHLKNLNKSDLSS